MDELIGSLRPFWHARPAAGAGALHALERAWGRALPADYLHFMRWSNGGEAAFGTCYLSLWPVEDVPALNERYQLRRYLGDGFLGIGTDGGPDCYGLEYGIEADPVLMIVPLGDLDPSSRRRVDATLTGAIRRMLAGDIDEFTFVDPPAAPSEELRALGRRRLRAQAGAAWARRDFPAFVAHLEALDEEPGELERRQLAYARARLRGR